MALKWCSLGTNEVKVCYENIPHITRPPLADWDVDARQVRYMLSCFICQILTNFLLPSRIFLSYWLLFIDSNTRQTQAANWIWQWNRGNMLELSPKWASVQVSGKWREYLLTSNNNGVWWTVRTHNSTLKMTLSFITVSVSGFYEATWCPRLYCFNVDITFLRAARWMKCFDDSDQGTLCSYRRPQAAVWWIIYPAD